MTDHEKTGTLIIIISIALIVIIFLLSGGYNPDRGFIWSFQYTMHLAGLSIYDGSLRWTDCGYFESDCAEIKIKHIISVLVAFLVYGFLIYKSILKNPTLYFTKSDSLRSRPESNVGPHDGTSDK